MTYSINNFKADALRLAHLYLTAMCALFVYSSSFANVIEVENAAVSSRSMIASETGSTIMKNGGNAIDAAVATAFSLAVTHPSAGNLGGGGFAVIRFPDGTVVTNDHREKAPLLSERDMFLDENGEYLADLARRSHLASGVPGSVKGLIDIHEQYGALTLQEVIAPAIRQAEEGFELPAYLARQFAARQERFSEIPSTAKVFYKPDGRLYEAGELFKQPDLAETLKRISEKGASGFYEGETAQLIVDEMKRGKGIISLEDLAAYESVWREPIRGSYRGFEIYSMPPPSSGGVLLVQMLNMLERFDIRNMGLHDIETVHTMVEVERRAYADRAIYLGDSDFYKVPIDQLISKSYATKRASDIDPLSASDSEDIAEGEINQESTETTHFSVIDQDGVAVAFTTTINAGYGSGIVVEGAGFLLNNEMDDFSAKPNTPNMFGLLGEEANAIVPQKRMLSSMTPTIVAKGDDFLLLTGSPGGSTIITTVLQVVTNVVDHGLTVDQSVNLPRFHHQWKPNQIRMEADIAKSLVPLLEAKGHVNVTRMEEGATIGDANSILKRGGQITAVSDGRNEGGAAGF